MWQAFGLYVPSWQSNLGWSAAALAVAFSVYQATSVLLSPLQALLLNAIGPKRAIRLGVIAAGGGMASVAFISSLPLFFVAMVVIGLGFSLCGGMSFSAIMVNWFERRRARALALMQVGRGVGGLMVMGVAASLEAFGWRTTMLGSGLLFLLAGSWVAAAMRDTPESCGLRPDGDPPDTAPGPGEVTLRAIDPGMPIAASLRTAAFWQINVANALLSTVVTALVAHLAVHLREVGFSLSFAATMVASVTFASTAGLLFAGVIGDRVAKRFVTGLAALGHAAAIATLALSSAPGLVIAAVVVHGFAWGVRDPLMVAMRVDYFGRGAFVHVEGIARVFVGVGMVAGPVAIAFLRERGGDFAGGFWLLAALGVVAGAALATARAPRRG